MNSNDNKSTDKIGLEEIVRLANKVGLEYVDAKKKAEHYELMKAPTRARIAMRHDNGELNESKLKRMTETDSEYIEFLERLSDAKRDSDRLRVRYESYKNLFDARRSILSYQKEEMKLL